jgi:hypothetical protein
VLTEQNIRDKSLVRKHGNSQHAAAELIAEIQDVVQRSPLPFEQLGRRDGGGVAVTKAKRPLTTGDPEPVHGVAASELESAGTRTSILHSPETPTIRPSQSAGLPIAN